jgi:hypothetical protein
VELHHGGKFAKLFAGNPSKHRQGRVIMTWGIFFGFFWMGLGVLAFLYLLKAKDKA